MKRLLRFALRALRRDLRAGELTVLGAALAIASGAVCTVGIFTDRIERLLVGQSAEVLAADLRVVASREVPDAWRAEAARRGLHTVRTRTLRSVLLYRDSTQLVALKAVGDGYPLRGQLRTAAALDAADTAAVGVPEPGTAWVDPRLLQQLDLAVGARIELGRSAFIITRVLTFEPDRGMNLFSIGPRILLRDSDLDGSGLVLPASRIQHRLLVAGPPAALAAFRRWLETRTGHDFAVEELADAQPELRHALSRAAAFLNLAALVSVLLAGVAVAMAARRYSARQADACAVLRTLGASRRFVLAVHLVELLLLGLLASLAGGLLGFAVQQAVASLVAGVMAGTLPPPRVMPAAVGVLVALVTLIGFALPALLRLGRVSPLQVLRRDLGVPPPSALAVYGLGTLATLLLMFWLSGDAVLTGWVAAGLAASLLALLLAALGLVAVLSRLRRRRGLAWRIGLLNLARRGPASTAQLLAFGLGLMVLLLLGVVRGDLLDQWRASVPRDAPNLFLVNIQPDETAALAAHLEGLGVTNPPLYPMVRGRLVGHNAAQVTPEAYPQPRASRLVAREFNLSFMHDLPEGNAIDAGHWWDGVAPFMAQASVETGLAETLGIGLGDRLRFQVAEREVEVTVTSLRRVAWDSFRVNFFVIMPPGVLDAFPATYITSLHLPPGESAALGALVRRFPSVTAIDVDALLGHLTRIIDRVTLAVELVFGFTVLAGLAVLYAAIHSTLDERRHEAALLRTLGARRRTLLFGLAAEFVLLGTLAGLLGALGAAAVGWLLATRVFELPYHAGAWLWLLGAGGGALVVGLSGLLGTWRTVDQPPLQVLRRR